MTTRGCFNEQKHQATTLLHFSYNLSVAIFITCSFDRSPQASRRRDYVLRILADAVEKQLGCVIIHPFNSTFPSIPFILFLLIIFVVFLSLSMQLDNRLKNGNFIDLTVLIWFEVCLIVSDCTYVHVRIMLLKRRGIECKPQRREILWMLTGFEITEIIIDRNKWKNKKKVFCSSWAKTGSSSRFTKQYAPDRNDTDVLPLKFIPMTTLFGTLKSSTFEEFFVHFLHITECKWIY